MLKMFLMMSGWIVRAQFTAHGSNILLESLVTDMASSCIESQDPRWVAEPTQKSQETDLVIY